MYDLTANGVRYSIGSCQAGHYLTDWVRTSCDPDSHESDFTVLVKGYGNSRIGCLQACCVLRRLCESRILRGGPTHLRRERGNNESAIAANGPRA